MLKQLLSAIKISVLALVLSFGLSYALAAWTAPSALPPDGNMPTPINVATSTQYKVGGDICTTVSGTTKCLQTSLDTGATAQTKTGALTAGSLTTAGAVTAGSVSAPNVLNTSATAQTKTGGLTAGALTAVGLTNTASLRVTGGAPGLNKVLTSDASGNATWQAGGSTIDPAPIGSIVSYAGATAPAGYLFCNGAAVSRATYASLFTAIGTTYGAGNGSTTFNLPDLRGEFIRGLDQGRGVDAGRALGTAQGGAIQSHTHLAPLSDGGHFYYAAGGGNPGVSLPATADGLTSATGGTETRPRNVALNYIIKAVNNSEMVLVSAASADNLGNHTATQALNMGTNNIVASGADTSYGATTLQGEKNAWGGINFKSAAGTEDYGTLMMSGSYSGFFNAAHSSWRWYVDDFGNTSQGGTASVYDVHSGLVNKTLSAVARSQIGVGQTWLNVTASRVWGATYVNSTAAPIMVAITHAQGLISMYVGGVLIGQDQGGNNNTTTFSTFIVPNGSTYSVSNTGGPIIRWAELR